MGSAGGARDGAHLALDGAGVGRDGRSGRVGDRTWGRRGGAEHDEVKIGRAHV